MKNLNHRNAKAQSAHALESLRDDLRANILARRVALQLSQADLAERSGVSRPVVSKIETASGDFQISALAKLSVVLRCTVSELLAPVGLGPVSDDEILKRARAPRSEFIKGTDLWAAIEESHSYSKRKSGKGVASRIPSKSCKGGPKPVVNGRKGRKN